MSSTAKILSAPVVHARSKALDYIELMKPELTLLSVLSTLCGYYLGAQGTFDLVTFLHTAIGTIMLGGGVGALNQFMERDYDAMMRRTERRPLPSGRLLPREVLVFGAGLSIIGILQLLTFTNELTGLLAIIIFSSYLFFYTPLKRITPFSTIIGGIPGALPPLMGWAAVRNSLSIEGWALFAILFCWQMPHFYGLAWMYRKDYDRAGYKMLTVVDTTGRRTSRHILFFTLALFPATMLTTSLGLTGKLYLIGAMALNFAFLYYAIVLIYQTRVSVYDNFARINLHARKLFFASLWYLPLLMALMCLDRNP